MSLHYFKSLTGFSKSQFEKIDEQCKKVLIDVGKYMKPKDYFGNKPYAFSTEDINGDCYVVVSELNVPGYRVVYFGKHGSTSFPKENEARNIVDLLNHYLGLNDDQEKVIILSSMFEHTNPRALVGSLKDAYFGLLEKNDSKEKTI